MAVAVGSTLEEYVIRLRFIDIFGSEVTKTFSLDPTLTTSQVASILGYLAALSNAGLVKGTVGAFYPITGWPAAVTPAAAMPGVADFAELTFTQTDPVNSNKVIEKGFIIPANIVGINGGGNPNRPVAVDTNTPSTNLDHLVAQLIAHLAFTDHAGTVHSGGWTYQSGESGFSSGGRVLGQ